MEWNSREIHGQMDLMITQCPIRPGGRFSQKVIFSVEERTLWWHAHNDWSRATVHGAIINVYPKLGTTYPFPKPHAEQTLILGIFLLMKLENFALIL